MIPYHIILYHIILLRRRRNGGQPTDMVANLLDRIGARRESGERRPCWRTETENGRTENGRTGEHIDSREGEGRENGDGERENM